MYCKSCGLEIDSDSKFCKRCGSSISNSGFGEMRNRTNIPKNRMALIIAIISLLVLAAGIFLFVFSTVEESPNSKLMSDTFYSYLT